MGRSEATASEECASRSKSRQERIELARFAAFSAVVLFYIAAIPLAVGRMSEDFRHLWVAGRGVATGTAGLYEAEGHRRLLEEVTPDAESLWFARNEVLGTFFYPPTAAPPYVLLGAFPFEIASGLQAALSIAAALLAARGLASLAGGRLDWRSAAILILVAAPFFFTFALSQNAAVTLAVIVGATALAHGGRGALAGALSALLLAKPNWWIAAGWLPFVFAPRAALGGFALGAFAVVALGAALAGVEAYGEYARMLPVLSQLHELPGYPLGTQQGLFALSRKTLGMTPLATGLAALAALGVCAATAYRLWTQRGAWLPVRVLGVGATAAMLINPHVHHYDVLPSVAGVVALVACAAGWTPRWRAIAAVTCAFYYLVYPLLPPDDQGVLPTLAVILVWATLLVAPRDQVEGNDSAR